MPQPSRPRLSLWGRWCLFWTLFIGVGAVAGAAMMMLAPNTASMAPMLPSIQKLPILGPHFHDFFWPGVSLLVVNGVTQLVAAWLIWRRHRLGPAATLACAVILLCWLSLQLFIIFGSNFMTDLYVVFALAEGTMAILWLRQGRQARTA